MPRSKSLCRFKHECILLDITSIKLRSMHLTDSYRTKKAADAFIGEPSAVYIITFSYHICHFHVELQDRVAAFAESAHSSVPLIEAIISFECKLPHIRENYFLI